MTRGDACNGGVTPHVTRRNGLRAGDSAIEQAARVVASAFGYGASVLVRGNESLHVVLPTQSDESDHDGLSGMAIQTPGRVSQSSRCYLPKAPSRRGRALGKFLPEQRAAVAEFDQQANMRTNGDPRRVRQFRTWDNRHAGMVVATARPAGAVLRAMSSARLDGPLADWLMIYSTQAIHLWPRVELYMEACGHPEWAASEAAARVLGVRRPWPEIAREQVMRRADCQQLVLAAEQRLMDWLERASRALLDAMG